MANCKGCYKEVTWDEEIRNSLGIRKPAELVNGKYVEHICPKYQQKTLSNNNEWKGKGTSTSNSNSYVYKSPNPNNYSGSSKDYENKQVAQRQQQAETITTIPTSIITTILETQKQILSEIEFLRSRFEDIIKTVDNIFLKQGNISYEISVIKQGIHDLRTSVTASKDDDDSFVDTDPDYATEFNNRITAAVKKEE